MSLIWNLRMKGITACLVMLLAGCSSGANPSTEQATEFWEAIASGDREAAVSEVDPSALTSGEANTFGRAATLEGQFDWYEAVDWEWALEECVEAEDGAATCTVTARNAWSEVLGVDPVEGTYTVEVGENGITSITDRDEGFLRNWSPLVFEVFANWVATNHPEDANTMFDFAIDVNDQILDLYRVNSERFVAAHSG